MFIRKYYLPISVFIVAIAGVGLYLLATQPPKEPIVIYKPVEPIEKPTEQPKAEAPVEDTLQGGHVHADGTWHEGPHTVDTQTPVSEHEPPAGQTISEPFQVHTIDTERFRIFEEIRQTLPSSATIGDVVRASPFVLTSAELQAMSTEELDALINDAHAKGDALFPEMSRRMSAWAKFAGDLNEEIRLGDAMDAVRYEYYLQDVTFKSAMKEFRRRNGGHRQISLTGAILDAYQSEADDKGRDITPRSKGGN